MYRKTQIFTRPDDSLRVVQSYAPSHPHLVPQAFLVWTDLRRLWICLKGSIPLALGKSNFFFFFLISFHQQHWLLSRRGAGIEAGLHCGNRQTEDHSPGRAQRVSVRLCLLGVGHMRAAVTAWECEISTGPRCYCHQCHTDCTDDILVFRLFLVKFYFLSSPVLKEV